MMKGMFVAGCQATKDRSSWHVLLYFVHRVGVGAELHFYWLHSLPIAKKNLLFFQLISILWEKNSTRFHSLLVSNIDIKTKGFKDWVQKDSRKEII